MDRSLLRASTTTLVEMARGRGAPRTGTGRSGPAAAAGELDEHSPVYIIEIGAGSGKLGYLILESLLRYRTFWPRSRLAFPFVYVVTDAVKANVEAVAAHPSWTEFIELGVADTAVFDLEKDTEVSSCDGTYTMLVRLSYRQCPADSINAFGANIISWLVSHPILVIGNYIFNSLTTDAFRLEHGSLFQANASVLIGKADT